MSETKHKKSTQYKNRYNAENYDNVRVVVPKGRKATVEAMAAQCGVSVNSLVNQLLREKAGLSEEEWKNAPEEQA